MKRALGGLLMTVALVGLLTLTWRSTRPNLGAVIAPDFVLPDLEGTAVRLQDLRGSVVLVNLWATWCPPCVEEMPSLQRLHERLEGRDFQILAVSSDENPDIVGPWIRERGLSFRVLLDPRNDVGYAYGVSGFPETFLIDRNGQVVDHTVGPRDWASPELIERIETLLSTGTWPEHSPSS